LKEKSNIIKIIITKRKYMNKIDAKLKELGVELPNANPPAANYVPYTRVGNLVFVSGQTARWDGVMKIAGKVGADLTIEQGIEAAKICVMNVLCQAKNACGGDLQKIKQIVKLNVYVNATEDFKEHPKVANGASDFLIAVFGDSGRHGRAAIGCASLPGNSAVEIEGVFEIG
jgi:enamine deaminase RidA (YjgF/YER057c/UK114 family)